ncbi:MULTISPECIES: hypothetical protein [unclassified Bradyrhizobium]
MIEFPRRLLRERQHSWNLRGVATTPGTTADSVAVLVRSDGGGFWSCTMSDVSLSGGKGLRGRDRQRVTTLLWRSIRQIADGGVNQIIVPRNEARFRPWPTGVSQSINIDIPHSDGALFDDDAGYYQSIIDISCGAAGLRDTSLDITINYAGALLGGESFSIEHPTFGWRLYEIATVDYTDDDQATITFNPPLREAVTAGTLLEFDRPRCVMRLAQTNAMDLNVTPWTFNSASVSFVEAFDGL